MQKAYARAPISKFYAGAVALGMPPSSPISDPGNLYLGANMEFPNEALSLCADMSFLTICIYILFLKYLYVRVGILLTCGKHLYDHIISFKGKVGPIKLV